MAKYCVSFCIAAFLLLSTSCSSPKNSNVESTERIVIANGDFESGSLAPWKTYQSVRADISTAKAHGGKSSLSESQGKGSVYQDIQGLQADTDYTISGWFCGDAGTTATAQIAAYDPAVNIATFSPAMKATEGWQLIKHKVRLTKPGTLRIHLFRSEGSGTIYWDDIEVSSSK